MIMSKGQTLLPSGYWWAPDEVWVAKLLFQNHDVFFKQNYLQLHNFHIFIFTFHFMKNGYCNKQIEVGQKQVTGNRY